MEVTHAELERILAESAFLKPFGMTLDACGDGECTLLAHHVLTYALAGSPKDQPG